MSKKKTDRQLLEKINEDVVDTYNSLDGLKLGFMVCFGIGGIILIGFLVCFSNENMLIEPEISTGTIERLNIKNPRVAVVDGKMYDVCWTSDLEIMREGDLVRIKNYDHGHPEGFGACKEIELVSVGGKEDGSGLTTR